MVEEDRWGKEKEDNTLQYSALFSSINYQINNNFYN